MKDAPRFCLQKAAIKKLARVDPRAQHLLNCRSEFGPKPLDAEALSESANDRRIEVLPFEFPGRLDQALRTLFGEEQARDAMRNNLGSPPRS